ncbi:MAG TPA: 16S rRNA (guanine(966)-N(2))-methyltransferase RsmD [bacterium]|nr:16S rRNA (guanine(966)-N(2))-methyltransferase RsmD [bacterium]
MRVISGKVKGRRLKAPNSDKVRPALDQVKEAIFNILFDVEDLSVLDLFAGCGSVGIEALSRGAKSVVFVEIWDKAVESIRENLEHCKLSESATVMKMPVSRAIDVLSRREASFELIFVDPPYLQDLVNPTLEQLSHSGIAHKNSIIVVEHHPKEPVSVPASLILTDSRKYGQTRVSFLKPV